MSRKYTSTNNNSNSFGGGDVIIDVFRKRGIIEYIDSKLGKRSPRAEYSYGEGFITWFICKCRGARRFEEVYDAQHNLKQHPKFKKGMSPDTLLYMFKELSIPSIFYKKTNISEKLAERIKKGKAHDSHQVNVIDKFNHLFVDTALMLGLLERGVRYILDFDTTEVTTKVKDSRKFYNGNGKTAYCPATAMINKIPVYIENRNGDSNASFHLTETIKTILEFLKEKGIIIDTVRIDSAAFSEEFTKFINSTGLKYVTRAKYTSVKNQKLFIRNWEETTIKNCTNDIGDTVFHWGQEETRMVVKKVIDLKTKDDAEKIKYWGLITNDFEKTNEEIIRLYAQRGDAENLFKDLYEHGWEVLPMRKFEHNTVFLCVTALNYILYRFITKLFAPVFPRITENSLLKTFRDKYLTVATNWGKDSLQFPKRVAKYYIGLFAFT